MNTQSIEIVDVSLRDGLQSINEPVPTQTKIEVLNALYAAGVRSMEVTSFVSAAVPQMADAAVVLAAARELPGLDASVLVPTVRHAERALQAGASHLVFVLSASESHNRSNVRRSVAESLQEYRRVIAMLPPGSRVRLNLATAFDCPIGGLVDATTVMTLLAELVSTAPWVEVALCDTTGRATPMQVRQLFSRSMSTFPAVKWAFHGHDTYGMGSANVFAAWQAGVRVIDASCGGLGGCPFAPGATGNVATEDVVWMMNGMGVTSGIDLDRLCVAANRLVGIAGAQAGGRVRYALECAAGRKSASL
jgi:hydroxymethylglutaryl-CoA lyase